MKPKMSRPVVTDKVSNYDICQTPPHALEPLIPLLENLQNRYRKCYSDRIYQLSIWESAVGPERLMEDALIKQGYDVWGTDILYGKSYDYFTYMPLVPYDIEVTNVPFSLKYLWLEKAFERGRRFAFIVPYETTFSKQFQELVRVYQKQPFSIEVLSPERRINYKMPEKGWGRMEWDEKKGKEVLRGASAQMPTCWVTWGLDAHTYYTNAFGFNTFYVPMRSVKYNDDNSVKG